MKSRVVIGCVALLASVALPVFSVQPIRAGLTPVKHPGLKLAPAGVKVKPVGNVWMMDSHEKKVMLSHSGLASDLKIASDGKTIGWTEGQIVNYEDRDPPFPHGIPFPMKKTYFPAVIVIHRPGQPDRRLVPKKLYTVIWRFEKGGAQVGIGSQGGHGLYFLQLFDAKTGKLLQARNTAENYVPAWAENLGQ